MKFRLSVLVAAAVAALALPAATASAQTSAPTDTATTSATRPAAKAKLFLNVAGRGTLAVGNRLAAKGRIRPFVAGQRVELRIGRKGHVVRKRTVAPKPAAHTHPARFPTPSDDLVAPGP